MPPLTQPSTTGPEQRAILEQAWQIARRPHLSLVPPLNDDRDDRQ